MENKWDIGDFETPKGFLGACPVCNDLVSACDKCGDTVDLCISISCGKRQDKGHICYNCWDELHERGRDKF